MPISQHRMIRLINAALDYKQALERLLDFIKSESASPNLKSQTTLTLLDRPAESLTDLTLEYQHFQRNANRNNRISLRETIKRREAGVSPRKTIPRDSILEHKGRYLPLALADPTKLALSISQQSKASQEGAAANLDFEKEGYCSSCGAFKPTQACERKDCGYWSLQLALEEQQEEEEASDLKL